MRERKEEGFSQGQDNRGPKPNVEPEAREQ